MSRTTQVIFIALIIWSISAIISKQFARTSVLEKEFAQAIMENALVSKDMLVMIVVKKFEIIIISL
jgi:hypothetical protein